MQRDYGCSKPPGSSLYSGIVALKVIELQMSSGASREGKFMRYDFLDISMKLKNFVGKEVIIHR